MVRPLADVHRTSVRGPKSIRTFMDVNQTSTGSPKTDVHRTTVSGVLFSATRSWTKIEHPYKNIYRTTSIYRPKLYVNQTSNGHPNTGIHRTTVIKRPRTSVCRPRFIRTFMYVNRTSG